MACWLGVAAAAPVTADRFAWRQAVRLASPAEAVHRFELPRVVYEGSRRRDLGDVRFFNGTGDAVPHAFVDYAPPDQVAVERHALAYFPLRADGRAGEGRLAVSVRQAHGGTLVSTQLAPAGKDTSQRMTGYIVDASSTKASRRALILDWRPQAAGTVLPVRVDAGDDLQSWRRIAAGSQLVDLHSGGQRLLQDRIDLAGDASRYYRISWPEGHAGIVVSSIAIETGATPMRPSRVQWTLPVPLRPSTAAGDFLFESPGLPVEAIRLHLPENNTTVAVRLYARRTEREPWRELARTVAYRLRRANEDLLSPPIPICCTADRFWRVAFDQRGGGIGQGEPRVELAWTAQQGIFVARGAGPYSLAYGNADIAPSSFAVTDLLPGYRPDQYPSFPEAGFDTPIARPPANPDVAPDWRSIGLWSVLVAGVMLLAAMAWRLLGQLRGGTGAAPAKDAGERN
jgi:hypothetical protein